MKQKDSIIQAFWITTSMLAALVAGVPILLATTPKLYALTVYFGLISILCAIRSTVIPSQLKD